MTTTVEPNSDLEAWEHRQNRRSCSTITVELRDQIERIRRDVPLPKGRKLESDVVISRVRETDRVQVYFPDISVAGEGRCLCEASLEAFAAFKEILDSIEQNKDWAILPAPDRSLGTRIAVLKTSLAFFLLRRISRHIPVPEAEEARLLKIAVAEAL